MSNPRVELHILDHGVITLELDADKAPNTTQNFLNYVNIGLFSKQISVI